MRDDERAAFEEACDDLSNMITLTDEDGQDAEFEFLDCVEYNGHDYAILLPAAEIEGGRLIIMRIEESVDGEIYIPVEDTAEATGVFNVFKKLALETFGAE